jgi:chemotaxis protein methyltransferase CheR
MSPTPAELANFQEIGPKEFDFLRTLLRESTGIHLNDSKAGLMASRLARRVRELGFQDYAAYCKLLASEGPRGNERQTFINCITTNKTSFFRENHHFQWMREVWLPRLQQEARAGGPTAFRIWSAGCSTGEEPWSIAMTLAECGAARGLQFRILASDIDSDVLARASAGVYRSAEAADLPDAARRRWFTNTTVDGVPALRVNDSLRGMVTFQQLNLMEPQFRLGGRFDLIFCRNVMIYFERATQSALLRRYADVLHAGGHLIIGHSESMQGLSEIFENCGTTIFRRTAARVTLDTTEGTPTSKAAAPLPRLVPAPSPIQPCATPAREAERRRDGLVIDVPNPKDNIRTVRIHAGGVFASRDPVEIRTLLGSCVSACIYDTTNGVGGMNHFLLPHTALRSVASTSYGAAAMEQLINELLRLGADRRRLVSKVFGASHVVGGPSMAEIPKLNASFVMDYLERERIGVKAQLLLGRFPLDIRFRPQSGQVFAREVPMNTFSKDAQEEAALAQKALQEVQKPTGDSITLFN